MGKREKKIEVIQKYLRNCYTLSTWYVKGEIPVDKYRNACSSYAGNVDYHDVFGLIDDTVFGSAKKGMLFAEDRFYYDTASGGACHYYSEGITFNSLTSSYNKNAVNELLGALYEIETEPSGWDVALELADAFLDGVNDGLELTNEFLEGVNEGVEFVEKLNIALENEDDDAIEDAFNSTNPELVYGIGMALYHGINCEVDYDFAFFIFINIADKDCVEAQCILGQCYYYGHGVEENELEAAYWFDKAVANGDCTAQSMRDSIILSDEEETILLQRSLEDLQNALADIADLFNK